MLYKWLVMVTKHSPVWDQLKKKHCSSKTMTEVTVPANIFNDITLGSLPSRDQVNKSEWGKYTRFRGWGRETTIVLAWTVNLNEDLESSHTSQRGVRAEPSNGKVRQDSIPDLSGLRKVRISTTGRSWNWWLQERCL